MSERNEILRRRVTYLLTQLHPYSELGADRAYRELAQVQGLFLILEEITATDPKLQKMAARAALRIDREQGIPLVLSMLDDPTSDSDLKVHICGLLSQYGDSRAINSLLMKLEDLDSNVRYSAAFALGKIGDQTALPGLQKAKASDNGTDYEGRPIKEVASRAIKEIRSRFKAGNFK